jgi:ubiquinone/menaquinone biosynthesis C-methylase UbiE
MIPEEQKNALDSWQTSARYWDKYRALIAQIFAPLTSVLVDEARIKVGQRVLDIGGGTGEPALTISSIVGPTGSVMYTDPVAGMVETTQAICKETRSRWHVTRNQLSDLANPV